MTAFFKHKKLRSEKTLGERLRSWRKRKGLTLEQAEEATRVSLKYLAALEADQHDKLPADIYVVGFLTRYGDFLGLDTNKIIADYRYESELYGSLRQQRVKDNKDIGLIKPNASDKWLKSPGLIVTPKIIIGGMIIFLVLGIMGYVWYQVKSFAAAPPLEISGSAGDTIVKVSSVTIEGQTDSSANLSINGQPVALDTVGHFSQEIKLVPGMNTVEITAKNKTDKITRRQMNILAEY